MVKINRFFIFYVSSFFTPPLIQNLSYIYGVLAYMFKSVNKYVSMYFTNLESTLQDTA